MFSCVMMLSFSVVYYEINCFLFWLWTRNLSHKKKSRKSKEEINKEILKSMVERKAIENSKIIQIAENVVSLQVAVTCVKEYEKLIRSEKQNVINLAYRQGYKLHTFKESEKFCNKVKELRIINSTITFKINLYKLLKKIPALTKSTKSMYYFKNYFRQIKLICRASGNEFKYLVLE